ncbi:DUF29 domain-containing protein [Gloeobacter violaceus]|uniref:Glr2574 protein n=1 Tax=Gloeobacter violaceus (strain ATCC 29082 / PCC 7421) TaxID=251221 RepID=Q7NHG3_GLOVI|nr:DUF29 domain-containing protein [Gloeobacter violaceus]BAC90515.1 glr2574 [Gloeobacter violaceus PCC 7421]
MAQDWSHLASTSHYLTAVEIQHALEDGDLQAAREGIAALTEAMSRSDRRALRSQLIRLMAHIIQWETQPERRTRSWLVTIHGSRREIEDLCEDTPSLTRKVIEEELWARCLSAALREAEDEMGVRAKQRELSWQVVFETEYRLPLDGEQFDL